LPAVSLLLLFSLIIFAGGGSTALCAHATAHATPVSPHFAHRCALTSALTSVLTSGLTSALISALTSALRLPPSPFSRENFYPFPLQAHPSKRSPPTCRLSRYVRTCARVCMCMCVGVFVCLTYSAVMSPPCSCVTPLYTTVTPL
jgi:hypothetical protein